MSVKNIYCTMYRKRERIPGLRNISRRRETIFRKCSELSRFGVDVWVVICTGARSNVFRSSESELFGSLDRQIMRASYRPTWKGLRDYDRRLRERRPLKLVERLEAASNDVSAIAGYHK
ncbi:hypothetical protein BDV38DRAFT_261173 [Aspergillus pseudotamarii]|uniref:MADS-box domain-containing protein n=1 Tax=Aspergillus pseudotamarii TaxID=132259 RepID=A0A5N6SGA7_ASPPS|nr:uncharacterized protein BDV38DRAFT_261173 [Aspergillus pseudotamarii]KAE8132423.1 hypothetical protein BDV38DRAFT_261173 [Aspergillus pseudotamarii]